MASYERDSLEHYGVKGMKWGKRKNKDAASFNISFGNMQTLADQYLSYFNPRYMSDKKMNAAVESGKAAANSILNSKKLGAGKNSANVLRTVAKNGHKWSLTGKNGTRSVFSNTTTTGGGKNTKTRTTTGWKHR